MHTMKHITRQVAAIAIATAVLVALLFVADSAHADISNPHPTPPANSVTTAMLQNGAVTPPILSEGSTFYVNGLIATTTTANSLIATTDITDQTGSTSFNGVHYSWPASGGSAGTFLSTDGSGNLSFTAPPNNNYGNGSDGTANITSGTTTLSRDMFYSQLTVASGAVLDTNGYKVYVSGTLTDNGSIENDAGGGRGLGNGANGSGTSHGSGGNGANGGSLAASPAGGAGSDGAPAQSGNSASGAGTAENPCDGVAGVTGGSGGTAHAGGGAPGGAGACTTEQIKLSTFSVTLPFALTANSTANATSSYAVNGVTSNSTLAPSAGSSGGTGGGSGQFTGNGGGGGGAGGTGGIVYIVAFKLVIGSGAFIEANGGNGGNGDNGSASPNAGDGGGGGGGGGSGGVVVVVFNKLTNSGTIQATAGTGGAGGNGAGNGTNGSTGNNGNAGSVYQLQVN